MEEKKKTYEPYHKIQENILAESQSDIKKYFANKIKGIKTISFSKLKRIVNTLYSLCRLHYISLEYSKVQRTQKNRHHPILVKRGQIYNALITENIGSELCGNHLVVILSNKNTNIFASKVNVVPIEGDGRKIPKYLVKLENNDLLSGTLDKDPSRIIIPEIITIDKARLDRLIGEISPDKMKEVNNKIFNQLELKN